jgi:hypothetical protein
MRGDDGARKVSRSARRAAGGEKVGNGSGAGGRETLETFGEIVERRRVKGEGGDGGG